jgi:hypothetical protein
VVDFGDKSIDLSVSSRVNKLNNVLQREFCLFLHSLMTDPLHRVRIDARVIEEIASGRDSPTSRRRGKLSRVLLFLPSQCNRALEITLVALVAFSY